MRPIEKNITSQRAIRRGSIPRAEAPAPREGDRRCRPRPTAVNDIAADGLAAFAPPVRYLARMTQPPNLRVKPPPPNAAPRRGRDPKPSLRQYHTASPPRIKRTWGRLIPWGTCTSMRYRGKGPWVSHEYNSRCGALGLRTRLAFVPQRVPWRGDGGSAD